MDYGSAVILATISTHMPQFTWLRPDVCSLIILHIRYILKDADKMRRFSEIIIDEGA